MQVAGFPEAAHPAKGFEMVWVKPFWSPRGVDGGLWLSFVGIWFSMMMFNSLADDFSMGATTGPSSLLVHWYSPASPETTPTGWLDDCAMDGYSKTQSKMDELGVKRPGNLQISPWPGTIQTSIVSGVNDCASMKWKMSGRAHHCCALRNQSVVRLLVLTADSVLPCPIDSDGEKKPCLHWRCGHEALWLKIMHPNTNAWLIMAYYFQQVSRLWLPVAP